MFFRRITIGIVSISLVAPSGVFALQSDRACTDVQAVFARGSGAEIGSKEYTRFDDQVSQRLDLNNITFDDYDLGHEGYGGYQYPAIEVGDPPYGNAIGAKVSSGMANDYGDSVKQGVKELQDYLAKRIAKCPGIKVVLGGYSQGAQVMNQALIDMPDRLKSNIVFTALFGDPKLYLPEGEGINPPACRGEQLSKWRRVIANCDVDNGSLGARKPYLPSDYEDKTGLWCNGADFVCGSTKFSWENDGHGKYADEGGAIDQAVQEIAEKLTIALPDKSAAIDAGYAVNGVFASGLDVAFVLNLNSSDPSKLDEAKAAIRSTADAVWAKGGRVALTVYDQNLSGGGFITYPEGASGNTPSAFVSATNRTAFYALIDRQTWKPLTTNRLMITALSGTLGSLNWQQGASKAIIVITEDGTSYPDQAAMRDYVVKKSMQIDPVNIYPVVSEATAPLIQDLADRTAGKVMTLSGDVGSITTSLQSATSLISQRPIVVFKNNEYKADVGQPITFDVSGSYLGDATIVGCDWDFNVDGVWDQTTTVPHVSHAYNAPFSNYVQARVRLSNGSVGSMTAIVNVGQGDWQTVVQPPSGLKITEESTTDSVNLQWDPSNEEIAAWFVSVNGIVVGRLDAASTRVEVTDLIRDQDNQLGLRAVGYDGTVSDEAGVTVNRIVPASVTMTMQALGLDNPTTGQSGKPITASTASATIFGSQGPDYLFNPESSSKTGNSGVTTNSLKSINPVPLVVIIVLLCILVGVGKVIKYWLLRGN